MTRNQRIAHKFLQRDGVIPLDVVARLMREGVILDVFERRNG